MSAWGRTGRVTLGKKRSPSIDTERRIKVDGVLAGAVFYPRGEASFPDFGAVTGISHDYDYTEGLPSRDAAVMWVLRRVDPALWREERGAWLVRKSRGGECVESGWYTGQRYLTDSDWLVIDPRGVCRNAALTLPMAAETALRHAKAEATR